ncbi:MAG: hypothetical protein WKG32_22555 [Gemmatimonadaceae bacterium]
MTLKNFLLAASAVLAAYAWRRTGFRVPRRLPDSARAPRQLLVAAGCLALVVLLGYSAGEIIVGRAEVSPTRPRYASRVTEPRKFWGKVLPNICVALALGGSLIALGRAAPAAPGHRPRGHRAAAPAPPLA